MAQAHIGTVYIKVSPDSKDFRRDVEKQIGKKPLKQKLDVEVDQDDVSKQVSDALKDVASGKHKFKIQPEMDDALKAIDALNGELNALQRTHEIKFDLNKDSIVEELDKLWATLDGASKDRFTAKVEVIPDEEGYRQALRRIEQIRRQRIKPIEIPLGLTDEEIDAFEQEMEKKLAEAVAKRPPEKVKLSVDLDYDGLQSAIDDVDRRLKALRAVEIEVELDEDKLEELRDDLVELQKHSQLRITYSHDEAGYRSVIRKIDEILNKDSTVTVDFDTDEDSLRAVRDRMESALSWEPVMVTYDDDRAGRESLINRIQAELKRRALELEFNLNVSDGELRRKLKEMQDATPVELKVKYLDDVKGRKGMIEKIQEELYRRKFEAEVDLKADVDTLESQMQGMIAKNRRDWAPQINPRVNPFALAVAEAQLSAAARDRWVNLRPRIAGSLVRDLEGAFLAIAGLNSIRTLVDTIRNIALNFDEWAVSVGTVSAAVGSLVSVATVGLGAVLSIAKDTLQVFQGFAMVPTFLLSGAAALQTWFAIWNDFGDAVGGDDDALARIPANGKRAVAAIQELDAAVNRTIQNNFWGEMTEEVVRFTDRIGPSLIEIMGGTAKVMGSTISGMLDSTERLAKDGSLERFTKNHLKGMEHLGAAAEDFFDTLMMMGIQGSKYLPRLGEWVRELSADFGAFMDRSIADGSFDRWIENSVKSMESLARTAKHSFGILGGVLTAFEAQGGAGLHEMADGLERIDRWVNSSGVQAKMEGLFRAAMVGAANAGRGFADLSQAIWRYTTEVGNALRITGQLAGDFMSQLSRIDPSVIFQGFFDMMDGMLDFVNRAGPGFQSIADIFGRLGSIGGEVAREIAHGMNLTMGAIDGFIARIQGPLINAIHPLTRVFEDIAALGTPVLFAMADAVGHLLNVFSMLPAPIQNTITLLAIFNRTGLFAGAIAGVQKFQAQMAIMRGTVALQTAGVTTAFQRMATNVQVRARTIGTALMGAFGGGWGIALTLAIGAISAFAGETALAEAKQRQFKDTLDQTTGAMTAQSRAFVYDQLIRDIKLTDDAMDKLRGKFENLRGVDFEDVFGRMGTSVGKMAEMFTDSSGAAEEMMTQLREISAIATMGGMDAAVDRARELGFEFDVSKLSAEELRQLLQHLENEFDPLTDGAQDFKDKLAEIGPEIDEMGGKLDGVGDELQPATDAMKGFGDAATSASGKVDGLARSMKLMAGVDLNAEELIIHAVESFDAGGKAIEALAADTSFNANNAFNDNLEFDLSSGIEAVKINDAVNYLYDGFSAEIAKLDGDLAKGIISQEDFDAEVTAMSGRFETFLRDYAKTLRYGEDETEAFVQHFMSRMDFDPVQIEIQVNHEEQVEQAYKDLELLDSLGLKIDQSEYTASLDLDGDGFLSEEERVQGAVKALNELVATGKIDADAEDFDEKLDTALELGAYFDGEEFKPIFKADGTPFEEAVTALEAQGKAFNGTEFVAVADVETNAASDKLAESLNSAKTQWDGQKFIAMVDANGKPTAEGIALARKLGYAWHNSEWVAVVDAEGDGADAEITAAREKALRYEGIYQALLQAGVPPESIGAVAEAIAANEEFEGDYEAFLTAIQTEEGKAAILATVESLENVPDEVKAAIRFVLLGEEVPEEAKGDLKELDETTSEPKVHPEYEDDEVARARKEAQELDDTLVEWDLLPDYMNGPAEDAKSDKAELDGAEAPWMILPDYQNQPAENAKTDMGIISGKEVGWGILADSSDSDTKAEATKSQWRLLDALSAHPTIGLMGHQEVNAQVGGATNSLNTFGLLSPTAALGINGVGDVIAGSAQAHGSAKKVDGNFISQLLSMGAPTVVAAALSAFNADDKVDDNFTSSLLSTGGPGVVAAAVAAFLSSDKVDDRFRALFSETGARGVVSQANSATSAAQNTGRQRPTVRFGGDGSGFWSVANAIRNWVPPTKTVKVGVAMTGAASALLGADGALSGSQFKLQQGIVNFDPYKMFGITPFANGGVNYTTKPGSAHIAQAGQYIMYAEKETGGEAFIPLHPSKRARSLAIWEETGRRLNAYADGDIRGSSGKDQRAPVQVSVTNHYPKAEPASRTVNDGLEYAALLGFN